MSLKNLDLQFSYDSIRDDLYGDFFIPVLSNSVQCKRFGGTFSSKNFLKIAEGIKNFIENDGILQLVLFPNFSKEDIVAINDGLKNQDDVMLENWIKDYEQIPEQITANHSKALAWMIKNNFLEIKVLKITDMNGNLVHAKELEHISLLKEKIGIFMGNDVSELIAYSGNMDYDEDVDYSHLTTFRYWHGQEEQVDHYYEQFEKFWSGEQFEYVKNYNFQAVDLPTALENNMITIAPKSKSELNLERPFSLRDKQRTAVQKWTENNFNGIYEMATGTGKTRTAIGSIKELEKNNPHFISVIVVPTDPLGIQWKENLEQWGYVVTLTMGSTSWELDVEDSVLRSEANKIKHLCIVTSYDTYANISFQKIIASTKLKKFLIADEVHHAGAIGAQKGLDFNYDYRLGLTATLKRYFDDDGTKVIRNYFHDVVFSYTMDEAIRDGFLCEYNYHIRQVDLTSDEYLKYREWSIVMAKYYGQMKDNPEYLIKYQRASEQRANIVKSAINKLDELKKIVAEGNKLNFGLIYCNWDQIKNVQKILDKNKPRPIFSRQITAKKTPSRKQKYEIFQGLVKGLYDVILAINILDEGWDCPEVKNCVLMASSGNDKQYVQRRGRVLRPFDGEYPDGTKKVRAEIYDMCVIPDISVGSDESEKIMEKNLIKNELNRMQIMVDSASNLECKSSLDEYRRKFELYILKP